MDSKLLTAADLQRMGFSRNRTYEILRADDIKTIRIGRRLYLAHAELTRWLDAHIMQQPETDEINDA